MANYDRTNAFEFTAKMIGICLREAEGNQMAPRELTSMIYHKALLSREDKSIAQNIDYVIHELERSPEESDRYTQGFIAKVQAGGKKSKIIGYRWISNPAPESQDENVVTEKEGDETVIAILQQALANQQKAGQILLKVVEMLDRLDKKQRDLFG